MTIKLSPWVLYTNVIWLIESTILIDFFLFFLYLTWILLSSKIPAYSIKNMDTLVKQTWWLLIISIFISIPPCILFYFVLSYFPYHLSNMYIWRSIYRYTLICYLIMILSRSSSIYSLVISKNRNLNLWSIILPLMTESTTISLSTILITIRELLIT